MWHLGYHNIVNYYSISLYSELNQTSKPNSLFRGFYDWNVLYLSGWQSSDWGRVHFSYKRSESSYLASKFSYQVRMQSKDTTIYYDQKYEMTKDIDDWMHIISCDCTKYYYNWEDLHMKDTQAYIVTKPVPINKFRHCLDLVDARRSKKPWEDSNRRMTLELIS